MALEVDDDDVLGGHAGVGDAAGLDGDEARLAVDAGDGAPGEDDEPVLDELEVAAEDVVLECGEVHGEVS